MESESNPFFTTPQVKSTSKNTSTFEPTPKSSHTRKNSLTNYGSYKNKSKSSNPILFTPQTPYLNNNDDDYPSSLLPLSPQTTTKKNHPVVDIFSKQHHQSNFLNNQRNLTINPLRTPEATPRHLSRKRDVTAFMDKDTSKLGHPLFQTAPLTLGSGRRLSESMRRNDRAAIEPEQVQSNKKGLLEFGSSIKVQIEQDEEEEDDEKVREEEMEDDLQEKRSVQIRDKLLNTEYEDDREKMLMNYTSSESESDEDNKEKTDLLRRRLNIAGAGMSEESLSNAKGPITPPMQIMDESFILEKFGNEKCKFEDIEDPEDVQKDLKNRVKYSSPFLVSAGKIEKAQKKKSIFNPRFENEIEMVYHATGEKFYVGLSEEGKKIKPKKLNFEEFRRLGIGSSEDLLRTPPMSSSHKMSIKGLLNHDEDESIPSEDEDNRAAEEEGVRHEKIENPFRTKFATEKDNHRTRYTVDQRSDGTGNKEMHNIEYVNQTTGRHIVEEMDDEQLRIKPKRLDFSGC